MSLQRFAPAGAVLLIAVSIQAQAKDVGIAAGVRGDVKVSAPGTQAAVAGIAVKSGQAIRVGERVRSGPDSGMQIILLDETVFTIGPNSDIEIEDFGFDAASGEGKVNASINSGSFKFVTGKVAQNKPENMTVRTPTAIMGVRGTIVYGAVDQNQSIIALGGPGVRNEGNDRIGALNVSTTEGDVDLRRAGFAVVAARGAAPEIRPLDAGMQQQMVATSAGAAATAGAQSAGAPSSGAQSTTTPGGFRGTGNSSFAAGVPAGVQTAALTATVTALADTVGRRSNEQAAQPALTANAVTAYDELRQLGGTAVFTQNGNALAATGNAFSGTGTYDFSMTINFGNRTVVGQFANIVVVQPDVFGNAIAAPGSTVNFAQVYNSLAGPFAVTGTNAACAAGVTCVGTVALNNSASRIADNAVHTLTVSGTGAKAGAESSGTGTVVRP